MRKRTKVETNRRSGEERRRRKAKEKSDTYRKSAPSVEKKKLQFTSAEYRAYMQSDAWKAKRQEAFQFHGRICNRCDAINALTVHHKSYRRLGNENVRIDLEILCIPCHEGVHGKKIWHPEKPQ